MTTQSIKNKFKVEKNTFQSSLDPFHIHYRQYFRNEKLGNEFTHIIFLHGIAENSSRHEDLFEYLLENYHGDLMITTMDFIGHGLSGGTRAHVDKFQILIDDFFKLLNVCKPFYEDKNVKTIVVSHSLGGLVALKSLLDYSNNLPYEIDKCIFCSPCIRPRFNVPDNIFKMTRLISNLMGKLRLPLPFSGHDLTSDHDKALEYDRNPLYSKFITYKMAEEIIRTCKNIVPLSYYLKISSLFLVSEDDRIVDSSATELFAYGIAKEFAQYNKYPGTRHDLLNETCRKEVFQDIINFIKGNG